MLRLKRARIKNFRGVGFAELELHPQLTIIIGDNATGKTAILDALAVAFAPLVRGMLHKHTTDVQISDFRVSGEHGVLGERVPAEDLSISVETDTGELNAHYRLDMSYEDKPRVHASIDRKLAKDFTGLVESDDIAPVIAYYREDRAYRPRDPRFSAGPRGTLRNRRRAYAGALGGRLVYDEAVRWFEDMENAELRERRERGEQHRDRRLDAVREAVSRLIPEMSDLRMLGLPAELSMTLRLDGQPKTLLTVDQLSAGFRVMLTLTMDIARRMADLNPQLDDPLTSPGVILIDEIDLHLHPRWQQLVVNGLLTAFPKVQFILTTHSPQVLTTVSEDHVRKLRWQDGLIQFATLPSSEGAESGRMLNAMGVNERPPARVSEFVAALEVYKAALRRDQAESPAARKAWATMQELSPDDPALATLELEKRRLAMRRTA